MILLFSHLQLPLQLCKPIQTVSHSLDPHGTSNGKQPLEIIFLENKNIDVLILQYNVQYGNK